MNYIYQEKMSYEKYCKMDTKNVKDVLMIPPDLKNPANIEDLGSVLVVYKKGVWR